MIEKKKKWTWKKTESRWNRIILKNHYKWCVENGRDITWAKNVPDVQKQQLSSKTKSTIVRTAKSKG